MNGKRIGYIRVSSIDQNPDRQLEGIQLDKRFVDTVSAKTMDRPQLQTMLEYVREGDKVFCHSIDRIARNLRDLHKIIDILLEKDVTISFIKEGLIFDKNNPSAISNFTLNMMGSFAEFERTLTKERQMEGIKIAKEKGAYRGGVPKLTSQQVADAAQKRALGITISRIAKDYGVSYHTLYNYLRNPEKKTK
jgi:DNA invertase Pin-like site-specific DNA recombinase